MDKHGENPMMIRKMEINDLKDVARVHRSSYPAEHFTAHFPSVMIERYYDELLKNTEYAYVAEESGQISGFLIGGDGLGKAISDFTKKNVRGLIKVCLMNPVFIYEKFIQLFKIHKKTKRMVLLSIAVAPGSQGSGIGKALIDNFEKDLISSGHTNYVLGVKASNKKAVEFYKKCGYSIDDQKRGAIEFKKTL